MTKTPAKFEWSACEQAIAGRLERAYGWDRERALQVAELAADAVRRKFGGQRYYIARSNGDFRARIRAEFNGRNITELSRVYGVSCRTIRRYLG